MEAAQSAVKRLLELHPTDSVTDTRDRSGYVENDATERFLGGLRKAGLPE